MPTLLTLDHVTLARADRVILDDVGLSVVSGERVALLGRNGAGKTTLLDVLAGRLRPDEGESWREPGLRLAYLSQHPTFEGGETVSALVAAANPYEARQARLDGLAARLDAEPDLLAVWAEQQAAFEAEGGYGFGARANATLGVLGLRGMEGRVASTLSGGERTRLALALALLAEPDLLLLDEPTNHLDLRMREWLEERLLAWRGAVVLTSHDRELLDRVATRSVW
ncbi:ATP-binding cassette domain-containing protein, partial [Deinococcus pimensis]|uniref:ATP-binding cassette domain-containing protein n=1 Tax=Deinococcus pimensis TaxID=309888 RepID=UPI0012F9A208